MKKITRQQYQEIVEDTFHVLKKILMLKDYDMAIWIKAQEIVDEAINDMNINIEEENE